MSRVETLPARRILLVEDDAAIRALLLAALNRRNAVASVDCAMDGAEAIALMRVREYSTILLDLLLPRVNGFEVLREMRSISLDLAMRTIVITAASEMTLKDFDRHSVFAVLRKPFDLTVLLEQIDFCARAALERRYRPRRRESDRLTFPANPA